MKERTGGKSTSGAAKAPARSAAKGGGRSRRAEIRRRVPRQPTGWRNLHRRPALLKGLFITAVFTIVAGATLAWTREQPLVAPNRIMNETRTVRVDFSIEDREATESRRELARNNAPRVYIADTAVFQEIESSLTRLPTALADVEEISQVAPDIRERFHLTQERLDAVRAYASDGEANAVWGSQVGSLMRRLRELPAVSPQTYQREQQAPSPLVELRQSASEPQQVRKERVINIESSRFVEEVQSAVQRAGFTESVAGMIVERLVREKRPLFVFDQAETQEVAQARADMIEPRMITHKTGSVIYSRGEELTGEQYSLLLAERAAFYREATTARIWLKRAGAFGAAALVAIAIAAYTMLFSRRITRNPMRAFALCALLLGTLAGVSIGSVMAPQMMHLFAMAAIAFVAMILVIAYDQRTAGAITTLYAVLVTVSLTQSIGFLAIGLIGAGAAIWRLPEIRSRDALVRAGVVCGGALIVATLVISLLEAPLVEGIAGQIVANAAIAGLGGLIVGVVTLGILPTIEKVFGILTGMSLIELRDPKQPLLRELQQRAPGTYSHSLTVASLAESAADAISADSLHVYVGALYHDVGKMNKPDYFVENQTSGFNRHSRLSPAMSLLVIVGHVKDGVELAREYGIPRSLHHYIESHHGATLVEYFYHAAQQKAEEKDAERPAEIEYRYPGPKPRSKEAAILMLCDGVESATRAMSDPSPARIEALVDKMARKRLLDGQFDNCDLTLRELHIIEESLIKQLCSVYHGRIAYPKDEGKPGEKQGARTAERSGEKPAPAPQPAAAANDPASA